MIEHTLLYLQKLRPIIELEAKFAPNLSCVITYYCKKCKQKRDWSENLILVSSLLLLLLSPVLHGENRAESCCLLPVIEMEMEIAPLLSPLDLITELPSHITEHILTFLPLPDAVRTSILSRKWRYRWTKIPHLVFDDSFNPHGDIVSRVLEILLVHQGPIIKFKFKFDFDPPAWEFCSEINNMILFLSRNGIQDIYISNGDYNAQLPSHIFSCLQLRHLYLAYWKIPRTFGGFSKLVTLEFFEVNLPPEFCISGCPLLKRLFLKNSNVICNLSIDAPNLKVFRLTGFEACFRFINAPLLKTFSYVDSTKYEVTSDLVGFFYCVPLIEHMILDKYSLKYLAEEESVPRKLPAALNYLRDLVLFEGIDLTVLDNMSHTLCLLRSSPNLQTLHIEVLEDSSNTEVENVLHYLGMQDYDFSLNKIRKVVIEYSDSTCNKEKFLTRSRLELEFLKFLLAISPKLETIKIVRDWRGIEEARTKILVELTQFSSASQNAEILLLSE